MPLGPHHHTADPTALHLISPPPQVDLPAAVDALQAAVVHQLPALQSYRSGVVRFEVIGEGRRGEGRGGVEGYFLLCLLPSFLPLSSEPLSF